MKRVREKRPPKVYPSRGDVRTRRGFLWFPKAIEQKELIITRWLETAEWKEEFQREYTIIDDGWKRWVPIVWLDIKETTFQSLRDLGDEA